MPLPAWIHTARREAEQLHKYQIRPGGNGYVLWVYSDGWKIVAPYHSREAAEDHLFNKLAHRD